MSIGYVIWGERGLVSTFRNLTCLFATTYLWWASNNCFTGKTFIALRNKEAVSGLLKQVKGELFSKEPQLCWHALSLLILFIDVFIYSILCVSRAPRSGCWTGLTRPWQILLALLDCLTAACPSSNHLKLRAHLPHLVLFSAEWQGFQCNISTFW